MRSSYDEWSEFKQDLDVFLRNREEDARDRTILYTELVSKYEELDQIDGHLGYFLSSAKQDLVQQEISKRDLEFTVENEIVRTVGRLMSDQRGLTQARARAMAIAANPDPMARLERVKNTIARLEAQIGVIKDYKSIVENRRWTLKNTCDMWRIEREKEPV
jgi:hypothetical protein